MTFDRIAGDKVYDDSGYGNHGNLAGLSKLARDAGKCGHGLRFQGGTEYSLWFASLLVIYNKSKDTEIHY